MHESAHWLKAQAAEKTVAAKHRVRVRDLFQPRYIGGMAFLVGMYLFWNLWAGTNGFFFPYILRTVGSQTQAMSVTLQMLSFGTGMLSIAFIFMPLSDRVNQRALFAASALIQIVGMALLAIFHSNFRWRSSTC
ncbi:hypothetical protein [Sphingomonas sp. GC_Shp_3]|uniref:hypothetical protein n=1 Tax=Sphingomonas sp. GC_Shp_3 TaxID=2937383 RepID=UPI002269F8B1|nr:hypothetical protein [Sphingomonas sp. GC_Shp_3]